MIPDPADPADPHALTCGYLSVSRCGGAQEVDRRWSVPLFGPAGWENGSGDRSEHGHREGDLQRPGRER